MISYDSKMLFDYHTFVPFTFVNGQSAAMLYCTKWHYFMAQNCTQSGLVRNGLIMAMSSLHEPEEFFGKSVSVDSKVTDWWMGAEWIGCMITTTLHLWPLSGNHESSLDAPLPLPSFYSKYDRDALDTFIAYLKFLIPDLTHFCLSNKRLWGHLITAIKPTCGVDVNRWSKDIRTSRLGPVQQTRHSPTQWLMQTAD